MSEKCVIHKWEMYLGLSESFEHCKECGIKKSEYEENTLSFEEDGIVNSF